MQFPFIGGSHAARSVNHNSERTVNLYPEKGSPNAKSPSMLVGTPGLRPWSVVGAGPIRCVYRVNANRSIVVSGDSVYFVTPAKVATLIGTIPPGTGMVSIADNTISAMLVTGDSGPGYIITLATGVMAQITDPDFTGATSVHYIAGRFVFNKPNSGLFLYSDLISTNIDSLNITSVEGNVDNLVTLIVDHQEVWAFGVASAEVFYVTTDQTTPFQRVQGAFVETGIKAAYSPAKADNTVYWLGSDDRGDNIVYRAAGYRAEIVSNAAFAYAMSQMTTTSDAIGWSYSQENHIFYVLTFPTDKKTWVYDIGMNEWHEREWLDINTGLAGRYRAQCQMNFASEVLVGDWENGNIYSLDLDYYLDGTGYVRRIRRAPHLSDPGYRMQFFSSLQIDLDAGNGLSTGQGSDPQLMLKISNDGGKSFPIERWTSIGKIGETTARAFFTRLGRARSRVYEVQITEPVKVVFIGANSTFAIGRS